MHSPNLPNPYADQLHIDTPEQVELRFPVAGIGSRMIAVFLDTVLQVFVYIVIALLAYVTGTYKAVDAGMSAQTETAAKWLVAGFVILNFVWLIGYFILFEAFWNGQTPGKRLMKLRVMKDSGRSITLFESLARNLIRFVDYFPSFYVFGLITMFCNRQNKRLGDLAAGTLVVHERTTEQPMLTHTMRSGTPSVFSAASPADGLLPHARRAWEANDRELPADAVARLTAADLNAIEAFFARAIDLPIGQREALGGRVAQAMCTRMSFERSEGMPPERLLELIAFKMRTQGR